MNYSDIEIALKWARHYGASNVTVEMDNGEFTDTPENIMAEFDMLNPGESFELISINFN